MNFNKYLPLTEVTYYILIALIEPGHGYYIMQRVEELSEGEVRVAAGTMYGAIEKLINERLIEMVISSNKRRKVYQITNKGKEVLELETKRLKNLISIGETYGL